MTIARNFIAIGSLYLIVGIGLGMHMGASEDHTLAPVHAHINLLGFAAMTLFGLVYRAWPDLAATALAKAHFWLHQAGVLGLLTLLWLYFLNRVSETLMPLALVAEIAILLGVLAFAVNFWRNTR